MDRFLAPKRKREPSSLGKFGWVPCPVCGHVVGISAMSHHLDSNLCNKKKKVPSPKPFSKQLPGHSVIQDFLSEQEEKNLLEYIDAGNRWKFSEFNGPSYGQSWGVRTDLRKRTLLEPVREMPPIIIDLLDRIRQHAGESFKPNEANAIDYRRREGHYLGEHCDDRYLSGPILVNICLAGAATMTYRLSPSKSKSTTKKQTREGVAEVSGSDQSLSHHRVYLPRRALQVQKGVVRYSYSHAIDHADLHDDRRVSITLRMNRHPGHRF